jgi:endonuclease YncB( thermonuclease family)
MLTLITYTTRSFVALALVFFSGAMLAQPASLEGQVVRVIDGDTVVLQDTYGTRHTLRLAGIDAPEKRMPYGMAARQQLFQWVAGQAVTALTTKQDRYGRTVATVLLHGQDVNLAMVQNGLAWHYTRYAREQPALQANAYAAAEQAARAERVGLWQDSAPVAPWDWRHGAATMAKKINLGQPR